MASQLEYGTDVEGGQPPVAQTLPEARPQRLPLGPSKTVLKTPLLEKTDDPKQFRGVDILRAIRSFDPCMPRTTHIHADAGVVRREVSTGVCGLGG